MSNQDSLHDRGSALENQFFAELDAKLLAELKSRQEQDNAIAEFSRISGIKDTKILEAVHKLGVTTQAFSAMRVFPLVAVAWGDGVLEDEAARGQTWFAVFASLIKGFCPTLNDSAPPSASPTGFLTAQAGAFVLEVSNVV